MDFNAWKLKRHKMTKGHLAVQREAKKGESLEGAQQVLLKGCLLNGIAQL